MLFKVGDEIIDTDKVPVALIFKSKEESKTVGDIIANIPDGEGDYHVSKNGNWWFMYPADRSRKEIDEWSTLTAKQKQLLDTTPQVSTHEDL